MVTCREGLAAQIVLECSERFCLTSKWAKHQKPAERRVLVFGAGQNIWVVVVYVVRRMAINYIQERENSFEIANGHYRALREITRNFNLKNEAHTLAFLIEIMREQKKGFVNIDGSHIQTK